MRTNVRFLINLLLLTGSSVFLASIPVAQTTSPGQLILPSKNNTMSFLWQGDSACSKWEANAAILIPVKIKHCPRTFYMQFDLGAPYSLLYKNKLSAIQTRYPKSIFLKETDTQLENFLLKADQIPVVAKKIAVAQFDSSTIDWENNTGIDIIGTIGADLIDGKVIVIDYPHKKLTITQAIPEKLAAGMPLYDFIYSHGNVLLPVKLRGKQTILYFDTGSSMFELLTNKETCRQLAVPNTILAQCPVKSWNQFLTANTLLSNGRIEIANVSIPIHAVAYIEGVKDAQVERMSKMGIGGMTGNKLFLHYILVLDTRNQKFGLRQSF